MSNWYFSDRLQQRHGPMSADELRMAYQRGELGPASLVWTDGFPNWVPLSSVGAALGIQSFPAQSGQVMFQPAKKGMSGCMVALIAGAVVAIPLIAILAAIALPAYNDYKLRAQIAVVLSEMNSDKTRMDEHYASENSCPTSSDIGFSSADNDAQSIVESREADVLPDGRCTLTYRLKGASFNNGNVLQFVRKDAGQYEFSGDVQDRYLPPILRNQAR
jgi:type IV pilus assembly protein PilA